MKHFIYVTILVVIAAAVLLFLGNSIQWMPVQASLEAVDIDNLFDLHIDVIIILYALVNGILLYSVFVFRRKRNDESEGAFFHSNTKLEIGWTVIPLIVVLYFAFLGATVLSKELEKGEDELEVKVTAQQWTWSYEYPEWGIASTELNLPVNRRVHFILTSTDVTHSFWVPEFRLKQDTVPGQEKDLRLTPTLIGNYKVRCAELCGKSHYAMESAVNVLSAEDFEIWRQKRLGTYVEPEGEAQEDPVEIGKQVATSAGCVACHSIDGSTLVGPSWKGLYGSTSSFTDGSSGPVDDAYLHQSIVDPGAKIVNGFQDVMPKNFGQTLTPAEITGLIEYIKTLQ